MSKQRVSILALLAVLVLCVATSFGLMFQSVSVNAAAGVDAEAIFSTKGSAAKAEGEFLTYTVGDNKTKSDAVVLRKNVALKWYSFTDPAQKKTDDLGKEQYFNLTFTLNDANFESFTFVLETTQMSMSKEGKTVNEVVFTPDGSNFKVAVNGDASKGLTVAANSDITITLSENGVKAGSGDFTVVVNGTECGVFKNIGKNYAKYISESSSNPVMPMTFKAATESSVSFSLKSLNGQSFKLNDDKKITDNTAPVLVVDSEVKQFVLGRGIDLTYEEIDVCSNVVTANRFYVTDLLMKSGDADVTPEFKEGKLVGYRELKSDKKFFEDDFKDKAMGGKFSVAFELKDNDANSEYYFLEWYKSDKSERLLEMVKSENVSSAPIVDFVSVNQEADGTITGVTKNDANISEYQTEVENASRKDGKSIQVGVGAYFYVPSVKAHISDDFYGYSDMSISVYYRTEGGDTQSVSGNYNDLRIPVSKEGNYSFRIVPTNNAGNTQVGVFKRGTEFYENTITSQNVWDAENVATFNFSVEYNGAVIEEPEEEKVGYVDVSYTLGKFEIIALSEYKTEYKLFHFVQNDPAVTLTAAQIRDAEQADGTNTLGTWKEISAYDSAKADDEGDNAYAWKPESALNFIPQEKGFYKVQVRVDDQSGKLDAEQLPMAFKVINITAEADVIPMETEWLKNNVLSVVFLGIGILCLIAIVILLVIKPKDKEVAQAEAARRSELEEKRKNRK